MNGFSCRDLSFVILVCRVSGKTRTHNHRLTDVAKMARFWARLCTALIQHWLTVAATWSATLHLSFAKVAKLVRQFARDFAIAISSGGDLSPIVELYCKMASVGCKRNRRKEKPGTIELLRNPELLEYVLT